MDMGDMMAGMGWWMAGEFSHDEYLERLHILRNQ
jgi:hypothetical protein